MAKRAPRARVLGAAAVLALVVVAVAGIASVWAVDDPSLPAVTADDLLASAIEAASRPVTISGDVSTTLDLGLPELPGIVGGAGVPGALATVVGEQRWKVWSSPEGLRVAHLLPAREQDLVINARDAWWWDSAEMRAVHLDFAAFRHGSGIPPEGAGSVLPASSMDPVALASALIRGVSPCASLSVQGTDRVAGRDVYVLALIPLSSDSRVGSVRFSIDAQTRLPLRVEVRSTAGDDAPIAVGFTRVAFDPIDPAMFAFDPPAGTEIRDASDPSAAGDAGGGADGVGDDAAGMDATPAITDVRVLGDCFGAVVAARLEGPLPSSAAQILPFAGPLGSVIAVDRGDHTWLLSGLVNADALEARAAALP